VHKIDLSIMADKWPSAIVARSAMDKFSGGLVSVKTMQNLDCAGDEGPTPFKCGRKVYYKVSDVVAWLESRSFPLNASDGKTAEERLQEKFDRQFERKERRSS